VFIHFILSRAVHVVSPLCRRCSLPPNLVAPSCRRQSHSFPERPGPRGAQTAPRPAQRGSLEPRGDLRVEVETDPEDYEEGPGTEEWGRRQQIRRVCEAVNGVSGERRFYEYAEDLPGWPNFGEPVWLWLSSWEDEELRRLGVVHEKRSSDQPPRAGRGDPERGVPGTMSDPGAC
jgi:hypothetical protein